MGAGVLTFLFFLSGAASLIYETIWIRVLSLGVGSTTRAMSLVLALFFLGLSAGSYLAGRYQGSRNPLRLYGWIEGALGLYGAVLLFALLNFSKILAWLPSEGAWGWITQVGKFAAAGVLLTPATLAMGATLPLLVRALPTLRESSRDGVSHWYAVNTFGAVAGAMVASFVLLPRVGLVGANAIAVGINLLIAAIALTIPVGSKILWSLNVPKAAGTLTRREWALVSLTALCGFSSLVAEVVWNKYLGIFLGNNVYGLGLVLSVYLFGLAVGAWACRYWLARAVRPERALVVLIGAAALLTTLTTVLLNGLPILTHFIGYYLARGSAHGASLLGLKSLLGTLALLPTTLCFGALFPLTVKLLAPDSGRASRAVSIAYSANTLGAILGSFLTGVVLLPVWGSSVAIQLASGLLLLGACIGMGYLGAFRRRVLLFAVPALAVILVVRFEFANIVKTAYSQRLEADTTLTQALRYFATNYEEFVWVKEGETSLITLGHDPKDGVNFRDYLRLKTNGLNESIYHKKNLGELPRYEALLGLLPYAFSETPRNAFVVGFGGGFTVDLLTSLPIPKVRVVELEKAILQAAERAHNGRNMVLRRPNLQLSVEDARYVLATRAGGPYDIIVSQPSQSWLAGAANLFTREFFEIVRSNLSATGVYSQWLNLYNMDTVTLRSLLRTFYTVFPEGAVFSGEGDQEMILVGALHPLKLNETEVGRLSKLSLFSKKLVTVPLREPADLMSHFVMDRTAALAVSAGAPWNTDRNAFAETRQSRLFYEGVAESESPQAFLVANYQASSPMLASEPAADLPYLVLSSQHDNHQPGKFKKLLAVYEAKSPDTALQWGKLGYLYLKARRYEEARKVLEKALRAAPTTTNLNLLLSSLMDLKREKEVLAVSGKHPRLADKITECYIVGAHLTQGRTAVVTASMKKMLADVTGYTNACGDFFNRIVGDFHYLNKNYAVAAPFYEAYQNAFRHDVGVNRRLTAAYLELGKYPEAERSAGILRSTAEQQSSRSVASE